MMAGEPGPAAPEPTVPAASAMFTPTALPTGTIAAIPSPPSLETPEVPPVAILESRRLTLELPLKIRAGDGDTIRMTLEMDDLGNITPTAEIAGHEVTGKPVQIQNLYETHQVIAEARLDLAGAQVMPGDVVSEPLSPGKSVTFYWSVRIPESGVYRGVAWLYMRYVPKDGGEAMTETVAAQLFEIEGVTFFGRSLFQVIPVYLSEIAISIKATG